MRRLFDPKRILLLAIGMAAFNGGAQAPLWSCNFTNAGWLAGWDNTDDVPKMGIAFGSTNITRIVDASAPGGAFLRLTYPAGSYVPSGSPPAPIGGAQFYGAVLHINGNTPLNALTLQYSLRFPTNFNFVKGGKLPGLYGGAGNTGAGAGTVPDGTDGFTTRFMWRTNGQGEAYPYLPTSPNSGGTELGKGNWHFAGDNQWHTLRQTCVLNDVGISNGVIQAWYDGVLVLNTNGLYFRSTNSLQIDGVVFQTFFGGGDTTWATPVDTYADFANFSVTDPNQTNPPPQLAIRLVGTNVVLGWPASSPGFVLESSPTLSPTGVWQNVSTGFVVGQQFQATNGLAFPSQFYRLSNP